MSVKHLYSHLYSSHLHCMCTTYYASLPIQYNTIRYNTLMMQSSPFSARSTQDHHHPGTPFRGQQQQPSSSRGPSMSHHRGGMEEDPNDGMPRSFSSHTEASSASVSSTPMSAASNAGSHRALFGRASTAHAAGAGTAGGSANPQAMQSSSSQQQRGGRSKHKSGDGNKQTTRPLKRFVYVKLNRAHMRITYQGYPM